MLRSGSVEERVLRPVVLGRPVRLAWPPSWAGHIPFAFWIIDAVRPETFVELGTHSGVSYSAFAQAVLTLRLKTACYAVDTWAGDPQAGFYGEDVYQEWATFHERHFAGQSRLVRSTFDAAADKFAAGSIDLLHIDGLHTYEAVRHDFETWRSKLSRRAVVLFHDTNVRERDFGVWKLWEELRTRHPSFTFVHGHGLGVLSVGADVPDDIAWLTSLTGEDAETVQRLFSTLGDLWTTHITLARAQGEAVAAGEERARVQAVLESAESRLAASVADVERLTTELATQQQAVQGAAEDRASLALQVERLTSELTRAAQLAETTERGYLTRDSSIEQLVDDIHGAALELSSRELTTAALEIAQARHDRLREEVFLGHVSAMATLRGAIVETAAHAAIAEDRTRTSIQLTPQLRRKAAALGFTRRALVPDVIGASIGLALRMSPAFRENVALVDRSGLFDLDYYASHTATRAVTRTRLKEHFIRHGDRAGLSPHPLFDADWYRERHSDLPKGARLAMHYLRFGSAEGRDPHPLFSSAYYRAQLSVEGGAESTLTHYLRGGSARAHSPHPLFDLAHYLLQFPGLAASAENPLMHYLEHARREMPDPHPLFSTRYYLAANGDLPRAMNPLAHFVRYGAGEGRNPHPLFDIRFYLSQRPDVGDAGVNALLHYLSRGAAEGADPHPLFDTYHYAGQLPAGVRGRINPLKHFVDEGWRWGFTPNPWFDPLWYLEKNPDVGRQENPLQHYADMGWREGRDPSARFSTSQYLAEHPEVGATNENPLAHFLRRRGTEGGPRPIVARISNNTFRLSGVSDTPRTIVVVSHVVPWPVRAGNDYRVRRLLQHWHREGYRIVLVLAPLSGEQPVPGAFEHLAEEFGNVILCEEDGRVQYRLRDCPDAIAALANLPVPSVTFGGPFDTDRGFCHDVVYTVSSALLQALGSVVLIAEYIFMTRVMSAAGSQVLKVVDTHDVFSQKGSNVIAFGIDDADIPPADEARRLRRADVVVAIQDGDARALSRLAPDREVLVAGVDADVIERPWPAGATVFVAGSGNPLNLAGMRDFVRYAWPRVLQNVPHARLRIAGGMGRAVSPGSAGVDVLGYVPDLAREYAGARVVINPTVAGTGLKIKTVEAVAHLVPVVAWPHGRDGLSEPVGRFVHESQDWTDFTDAVIRTLRRETSPFDAAAVADVRRELSPATVYGDLDRRMKEFFARAAQ